MQAITLCRSQDVEEYLNERVRKTKYPDLQREIVVIMLEKCVARPRARPACAANVWADGADRLVPGAVAGDPLPAAQPPADAPKQP